MHGNLVRLTYVSTLRPHVTEAVIDELVAKAAAFNKANGITGVLAVEHDRVCQILEGPADVVDALFQSIRRDERHHAVVQIEHRAIYKSAFGSWGMVRRGMVDMIIYAVGG